MILQYTDYSSNDINNNYIKIYERKNTQNIKCENSKLTNCNKTNNINNKPSYQQDEEYKEDIAEEEDGSKDPVGCFYLMEVEVTQDGTQQSEHSINEAVEVPHLRSQLQVVSWY